MMQLSDFLYKVKRSPKLGQPLKKKTHFELKITEMLNSLLVYSGLSHVVFSGVNKVLIELNGQKGLRFRCMTG